MSEGAAVSATGTAGTVLSRRWGTHAGTSTAPPSQPPDAGSSSGQAARGLCPGTDTKAGLLCRAGQPKPPGQSNNRTPPPSPRHCHSQPDRGAEHHACPPGGTGGDQRDANTAGAPPARQGARGVGVGAAQPGQPAGLAGATSRPRQQRNRERKGHAGTAGQWESNCHMPQVRRANHQQGAAAQRETASRRPVDRPAITGVLTRAEEGMVLPHPV